MIAIAAGLIVVSLVVYYAYDTMEYSYDITWGKVQPVIWMFADSARYNMDTQFASAAVRKTDKLYEWGYDPGRHYSVEVWAIKGLRSVDPDNVPINTDVFLNKVSLLGETMDDGLTQVKFGPFFNEKLEIDLDENSRIVQRIEGTDYKGFYGNVGRIAFENGDRQILCLKDYGSGDWHILFLMYKAHNDFYLIFIGAEKPFDMSIIHVLNLPQASGHLK